MAPPPVSPLSLDPSLRGGGYSRYNSMQGVGMGGGGGLTSMLMQMMGESFIGGQGMLPLGVTHQNTYDRFQSYKLQKLHDSVLKDSQAQDAQSITEMFRGAYKVAGVKFDEDAFKARAATGASFIPMAMQFPGMTSLIDNMAGYRGSATVMSEYMFQGGRFRMDPTTGKMGLGVDSMKRMNDDVFSSMFGGKNFHGQVLSAGQTGMMFNELQQLGMMSGGRVSVQDLMGGNAKDKAAIRAGLTGMGHNVGVGDSGLQSAVSGLDAADTAKLRSTGDVQGAIKGFDSSRVLKSLKDYSGAVKAMQEIFGDAGQPNAPMPQLMNALNQLTGGAFTQMNPAKAETTIRELNNLAKNAGVGLEGMMVMSQAAAQQAQSMGLDPASATPGILGAMLEFRGAFQATGMGTAAYGQGNINQMTMQHGALRASATASRSAMQMGTAMRLSDRYGAGAFKAGSDAQNYIDAVSSGQTMFDRSDGKGGIKSVSVGSLSQAEWVTMMGQGAVAGKGVDRGTIIRYSQQSGANHRYISEHGLGGLAQDAQGPEFFKRLAEESQAAGMGAMAAQGLNMDQGVAAIMGKAASDAMSNLTNEERSDPTKAHKIMGDAVMAQLKAAADRGDKNAAAMLAKFRNSPGAVTGYASEVWGVGEEGMRSGRFGYGKMTLQNTLDHFDKNLINAKGQTRSEARLEAAQQRALAPLGRAGSLIQRVMSAVQGAEEGDDMGAVVGTALGGEVPDHIDDALKKGLFAEVHAASLDRKKALSDMENAKTPKERKAAFQAAKDAKAREDAAISAVGKSQGKHGMLPGQVAARKKQTATEITAIAGGYSGIMGVAAGAAAAAMNEAATKDPNKDDDKGDGEGGEMTLILKNVTLNVNGKNGKGKGTKVPKRGDAG